MEEKALRRRNHEDKKSLPFSGQQTVTSQHDSQFSSTRQHCLPMCFVSVCVTKPLLFSYLFIYVELQLTFDEKITTVLYLISFLRTHEPS